MAWDVVRSLLLMMMLVVVPSPWEKGEENCCKYRKRISILVSTVLPVSRIDCGSVFGNAMPSNPEIARSHQRSSESPSLANRVGLSHPLALLLPFPVPQEAAMTQAVTATRTAQRAAPAAKETRKGDEETADAKAVASRNAEWKSHATQEMPKRHATKHCLAGALARTLVKSDLVSQSRKEVHRT